MWCFLLVNWPKPELFRTLANPDRILASFLLSLLAEVCIPSLEGRRKTRFLATHWARGQIRLVRPTRPAIGNQLAACHSQLTAALQGCLEARRVPRVAFPSTSFSFTVDLQFSGLVVGPLAEDMNSLASKFASDSNKSVGDSNGDGSITSRGGVCHQRGRYCHPVVNDLLPMCGSAVNGRLWGISMRWSAIHYAA